MSAHDPIEISHATACFARLAAMPAVAERWYNLGGSRVLLRYCDARLIPAVHTSLAHLEIAPAGAADLTLHLVASAAPPMTLSPERWLESSRMWKQSPMRRDQLFVHFSPGDDGKLVLLLGSIAQGCVCFRNPDRIPSWEAAKPLKEALHAWHRLDGGHIVHGAVVADERGAVLLAGAGGSGKSNTALACLLHSRLAYLADDLSLVARRADGHHVHSLYGSTALLPHDLERYAVLKLPLLDDRVRGDGKPTHFLFPALAERLTATRPLRAILLPCVRRQHHTRVVPATTAEAWKALVPSTLPLLPSDVESRQWLSELVQQVPLGRLELGQRREAIPHAIEQVLNEGIAPRTACRRRLTPTARAAA